MKLKHIKLDNGDDLIGNLVQKTKQHLEIHFPVLIEMDPQLGYVAKNWTGLSETDTVKIETTKVTFTHDASISAHKYYQEFIAHVSDEDEFEETYEDEIDNELQDIIDSRKAIKH